MIELSMLLWKKQPSWVHPFADFSKFLYNEIMDISSLFNRCDVIMDQYFEGSLKEGAREDHGSGTGLIITLVIALRFLQISSANSEVSDK